MGIYLRKSTRDYSYWLLFLFTLICLSSRGSFAQENKEIKIIPLPSLVDPTSIQVDSGKILITEEDSVSVFSLDDFKLLKRIGRRGEGPGEFNAPPYVILQPDAFLILNFNKISLFSPEGELIEEKKIPSNYNYGFFPLLPVGDNYVGFPVEIKKEGGFGHVGRLYDSTFFPIKMIYEDVPNLIPPPPPPPRPGQTSGSLPKQDFEAIRDCIDVTVEKDRLYVADTRKGFFFSVFDSGGNLLYEIDTEHKRIKVPKQYTAAYMKHLQEQSNWERLNNRYNFVFKDFFPAFFSFKINDEKIYAVTYSQKDGVYEIVQTDLKGKTLSRSFSFPLKPYGRLNETFFQFSNDFDIYSDTIYHLEYNFDKEWLELHITPIK